MKWRQQPLFRMSASMRLPVDEFVHHWNERLWLPKIICSDRQLKMIRMALDRPFFAEHWKEGIAAVGKSKFLRNKMKPSFRLDFFLDVDKFDKIVEGQYEDTPDEIPSIPKSTTINGREVIL